MVFKTVDRKNQLFFLLLILAYFTIGFYSIEMTSITSDETAYLGAAHAYTQGTCLNLEHPLILKLINAATLKLFCPDCYVELGDVVNDINYGDLSPVAVRLVSFNVGYKLLMENPERFELILLGSRLTYLILNSWLLFWLYIHTFIWRYIPSIVSLSLGTLYVFSPSFYSHYFLVSFDVAVAIFALTSILSFTLTAINFERLSTKNSILHLLILTLGLSLALNIKFSNLIILPIFLTAYSIVLIHLIRSKKNKISLRFSVFLGTSLLLQPFFILGMYRLACHRLSDRSILGNFNRYLEGIRLTLVSAKGTQVPFLDGKFSPINYLSYVTKILWFKENPVLFILAAFILINFMAIAYKKYRIFRDLSPPLNSHKISQFVAIIILVSAYPIAYIFLAKDSRFILGYRYFYPVLIFVYFLLSASTVLLKNKLQRFILMACLAAYIVVGTVGISQSLSYVNPLWTKEKWLLTNDSTLNWGQETMHAVQYLLGRKLLDEKNDRTITYKTFDVTINFNQYLDILSQQQNYPIDIQSYYSHPTFDPVRDEIARLPDKYLLIDSTVKQQIFVEKSDSPVARKNWEYLQTHAPIYSRNDIIFIYQLK